MVGWGDSPVTLPALDPVGAVCQNDPVCSDRAARLTLYGAAASLDLDITAKQIVTMVYQEGSRQGIEGNVPTISRPGAPKVRRL